MRCIILAGLALLTFQVFADADYTLLRDIVGTYPILSHNSNFTTAGNAEIFAGDSGVGFKLIPLAMATTSVPAVTVSSPKSTTELKRNGNQIEQTFVDGPKQLKIYYNIHEGYLVVDSTQCDGHACVSDNSLALTKGNSPGESISTKEFLLKLRGTYAINKVGGAPPHPESNTGEVSATDDPSVDQMRMPYCQPKGCDPGYLDMPLTATRVYKNGEVYTLLQTTPKRVLHFTWVEGVNKTATLTNYQYKLLTKEVVALEHVLQRQ